jgi:ABC-type lipoprotein export system ATPase subunit
VLGLLERLSRRGSTIVMVTHSHEVAQRAGRILRMADGLIVADEPLAAVLTP